MELEFEVQALRQLLAEAQQATKNLLTLLYKQQAEIDRLKTEAPSEPINLSPGTQE